jgi:phosphate/sulfate permease
MVAIELLVIAAILFVQPLIALFWAYLAYRAAVAFTFKRAEKAVDGRIDRIDDKLRGNNE